MQLHGKGLVEQVKVAFEREFGTVVPLGSLDRRFIDFVDKRHEKLIAEAVAAAQAQADRELQSLSTSLNLVTKNKNLLEQKLQAEQKKMGDLFYDAEQLRADLHKEIKDYRGMKKKLKSIILEFRERLQDLRNREPHSLQETPQD